MARKKVLIIKHGFIQPTRLEPLPVMDYGDVVRATSLLEAWKDCHVSWITAPTARELLRGNHLIDELVLAETPHQLPVKFQEPNFDTVINLERRQDWCRYACCVQAERYYGFQHAGGAEQNRLFPASERSLERLSDNRENRLYQEILYAMIGRNWNGQRYRLGYQPRVVQMYDIGLNYFDVGRENADTGWPEDNWRQLYHELNAHQVVSWQPSVDHLRAYMDWIASCRTIITCDSLGLHLAVALGKQVTALLPAGALERVYLYGCGFKLTPVCDASCQTCRASIKGTGQQCMELISVDMVLQSLELLIGSVSQEPAAATVFSG